VFIRLVTKSLLHIIIATTLLFSTTGVTITAFYCHDNLTGISIISQDVNCSKSGKKACCKNAKEDKNCCTSNSEFVQNEFDQIFNFSAELNIDNDIEAIAFVSENVVTDRRHVKDLSILHYRPPPILKDLNILYQSFLC